MGTRRPEKGWWVVVWWMAVCLVAGVARLQIAFIGICVLCFSFYLFKQSRSALPITMLVVACGAYAWGTANRQDRVEATVRYLLSGRSQISGVVTSFPATSPFGTSFWFAADIGGRRLPVFVRANRFDLHVAQRLTLSGSWNSDREVFRARRVDAGEPAKTGLTVRGISWRLHRFARMRLMQRLGTKAALPVALLLGEKGFITRAQRDTFVRLGISHLFALSGMHLALVAAMTLLVARRLGSFQDPFVAAVLSVYVLVTGEIHSLYRALVMVLLIFLARGLGRPVRAIHVLGVAFVCLLLSDPALLRSVGFQLSFAATLIVLIAARALARYVGLWRGAGWGQRALLGCASTLAVGTAVVVGVAPLQLYHFGTVSLVGPLATLVLAPFVGVILSGAIACVALGGVAGELAVIVLRWTTGVLEQLLEWGSRHTPEVLELPSPDPLCYYAGMALLCVAPRWWLRALGIVLMLASFHIAVSRVILIQ